ncbi:MAG: 2-amino-4-hydroxy-6-hydroxymethyldihydropteridine diphosphokinase [Magnetococcales bacterium]|nr:2-amino-4-hydroxy-6-hydroxymethyldihydropteridine diphosphokinase [Magnetococcales bacterium]
MDNLPRAPVLVAFGSNLDPLDNLWRGLSRLQAAVGLCAISTVYRTAPLPDPDLPPGEPPDPEFLNGAVQLPPQEDPLALHQLLRSVEADTQRVRGRRRYAPRTLDLDLALMGELVLHSGPLRLPDPDITRRAFVALPLAELAPAARHPLEGCPLAEIAARFGPAPEGLQVDWPATTRLRALVGQGG